MDWLLEYISHDFFNMIIKFKPLKLFFIKRNIFFLWLYKQTPAFQINFFLKVVGAI